MKNIYNLIGIAQRAGKTSSGAEAVKTSLTKDFAHIVLMSKDISPDTKDKLIKNCRKNKVPWIMLGNKYDLGNSIGKSYRVALTINDAGIAGAIIKAINDADNEAKCMGVVYEWPK